MMFFILDKTQVGIGVVQSFSDLYTQGLDSNLDYVNIECELHKDIQVDNHIVYQNKLFTIKEVSEHHTERHYMEFYAEQTVVSELLTSITRPQEWKGRSATDILSSLLELTDWTVGTVEDDDIKDFEVSYQTTLKGLLELAETFELEVEYDVVMEGLNIKQKRIHLLKQRGKRILKHFEYGVNASDIKRTKDSKETINAIIGTGKDGLTINGANLPHLLPEGYKQDGDFIYNEELLAEQGRYVFGYMDDTDASTKATLMEAMVKELQEREKPQLTYETTVQYFKEVLGEEPSVGDSIIVRDLSFSTPLLVEARIQEMETSMTDPSKDIVKLGNYKELEVNDFSELKALQDLINSNIDKWNQNGEVIFKQPTPPENPEEGNLWIDTSKQPEVLYRWNGTEWVEVGAPGLSTEEGEVIFNWLAQLEDKTNAANIIETIIAEPEFEAILNQKANVEDLDGLATGEMLQNLTQYVDGRTEENSDKINQLASELERTAAELTMSFQSQGGTNLIYNSLGWADFDFWTKTGEVSVLESDSLTRLGYGRGFIHYPESSSAQLTQDVQIQPNEDHSISFWLNKPTVNGSAGVEIWEGSTRIDDAFIGKLDKATKGYELATHTFKSTTGNIQVRIKWSNNVHSVITGLMLNRGVAAYHWQHAEGEVYNTNIKMNLNGITVKNAATGGYTVMSPQEFSGYAKVFDASGNEQLEKIFTLNGETTEVKQLQASELFRLDTIEIRSDQKGWTFVSAR